MGTLQAVGHFLLDLLIYLVNGLLEVLYQIVDHWAVLGRSALRPGRAADL
jgi:hypothetical protein